MSRFKFATLVTCGLAVSWGGLMALTWKSYLDPLTGLGLCGYMGYVGFQVLLAAFITAAFFRRWRLLGSLLCALALFYALPLPSKRGLDVRVANASSAPVMVRVTRMDSGVRYITLLILPGKNVRYRTAPGDYSEAIPFAIEDGTSRISATVTELRNYQVHVTDGEIILTDVREE